MAMEPSLLDVCNMNCKSESDAVIFDDGKKRQSLTYKEVSDIANELSRTLRNYIEDNCIVGICLDTQLITPALLIGILKGGAAFYNFNSDALQFVRHVLTHLGCSVILTDDHNLQLLQDLVEELKGEVIPMTLSEKNLTLTLVYLRSVRQKCHPTKLAYCITTSGTTGKPKIVKVPHSCIIPNIVHLREIYHLTSDDLVFLCSPLTFDPSIVEIFTTFSAGATLLIVPPIVKMLPDVLLDIISHRNKVTVMQATPTLLSRFMPKRLHHSLLSNKSSLRVLSLGGEEFPDGDIINSYRAENNNTMLINIYGITEVSAWATYYKVTEEDIQYGLKRKIPLGGCLKDTMVEVRDEQGAPITEGMGELYVGGFTRQCIIMSSDNTDEDKYDESVIKWSRTGDIVTSDSEGNLFYIGRRDDQVKRNGKRINLEEIRQVVLGYDGIQSSVTLMSGSDLVTFVTLSQTSSTKVCVDDVKKHVAHHLPAHCVPDDIVVLDYLPMTKHGKLDRKHLKEMHMNLKIVNPIYSTAFLKMKWKVTLAVDILRIKSDANFIQLGGSSLTAVHLLNDLEILFKVQLPHFLDKLINETFQDCDQYLYGKINGGDADTIASESDSNYIPTNETNDFKRKLDKVAPDVNESPECKVPNLPSSFTHTISKGNRYMKCKTVLTGVDDNAKTKCEESRNCMATRNVISSEIVKTVNKKFNDSDSGSNEKNQVKLFETERTTKIWNSNLCLSEKSASAKSLGISMKNVPEEHSMTNGGKTNECDNESPTLKDKEENHKEIFENEEELSTADIILQLEESWKFDTGKCVDASPLLAVSGKERNVIFIGSHSHKIFAIAMATGHCLWEKTLGDRIEANACLSLCGNFVIVGCYDGCIYSLDCDTGSIWWKYQTGSQVKCCPIVNEHTGFVCVGSHNQSVYCLDIQSRMVVWENRLKCGSVFSSPALDHLHNVVYVATLGGKIFSLDKGTGCKNWTFDCKKPVFSSLTLTENGILIGCTDSHMYHVDFRGTLIWKFSTGAPIFSSPSLFPCDWIMTSANQHQRFVFGSHDGILYCLSTLNGTLLWKTDVQSAVYSTPFCVTIKVKKQNMDTKCEKDCEIPVLEPGLCQILPDSLNKRTAEEKTNETATFDRTSMTQDRVSIPVVVVCATVGILYVMDARNGRILCEKTFPGELFSSPILYGNSVFFGCRDNNVYRLNLNAAEKF